MIAVSRLLTIAAATLAAQAQTPGTPTPATPTPGTITVALPDDSPPSHAFAEAIERALPAAGFLVLPAPSKSRYVARFTVERHARGLAAADTPETASSVETGNWTARLRATLPSDKTGIHGLVVTELRIDILPRDAAWPVWSGSAMTVQVETTPDDAPAALARKLAEPLIRRFPAPARGPISVP
ncbi:MAG TPA: hypothetical protein VM657_13335 [Sphingomonas sp.]|nr:hypothetical protein [Sphingomonas sp.]